MNIGGYELQVPFVTTSTDHIRTILEFANLQPQGSGVKRVVDLGSGDGRMVLEFAKAGALTYGYEHKPELVTRSVQRIKDAHLENKAFVYNKDFWQVDLSQFHVIYIYGMNSILGRLEKKLEQEAKPGTKIISNVFPLPTWRSKKSKNFVYLYIKR